MKKNPFLKGESTLQAIQARLAAGKSLAPTEKKFILSVIQALDRGELRVCSPPSLSGASATSGDTGGTWQTHAWIKQAILIYFRIQNVRPLKAGVFEFIDKIPLKRWSTKTGVRVVPGAIARYGTYIESGAILMPSYVNIGAYVGAGTLVDTWATVGSCAQIGKNVHLSGGVGIGGVLEPVQASPVIIEDDVFVGSRCIIVEGVRVGREAVIGAGVTLTASTKIIDVTRSTPHVSTGVIPPRSVVIPGTTSKKFAAGEFGVSCALIIGQRTESTDRKTSLESALRQVQSV